MQQQLWILNATPRHLNAPLEPHCVAGRFCGPVRVVSEYFASAMKATLLIFQKKSISLLK